MDLNWRRDVDRWRAAGVIDAETAARIQAFEQSRAGSTRLRWPILIALAFGAVMIAGGILLFVAANWDALSPASRFGLVLLLVSIFHVAGAVAAEPFPAMSQALHGIGTVALGAGIALSGQIFNLEEHWPGGIMLWAAGAALAWAVLRHTAQLALVAVLVPAWLMGEWMLAIEDRARLGIIGVGHAAEVATSGALLLALTYLSAVAADKATRSRRMLMWIGGVGGAMAAVVFAGVNMGSPNDPRPDLTLLWIAGWTIAFAAPLLLAAALRGRDAWTNAIAAVWVGAMVFVPGLDRGVATFGWWALGAVGLIAWGVRDGRVERINLGAAGFAVTVLAFYFSRVMDKLGRSAALLILGLLFLGGGWALERMRRQLVARTREDR
ncbi:MAG TPA: DUF2157 domain-containing protein [Vicinamibacterales bacterium]|nr:DUF2157 domain-containing protein [Vicinamibacterales bacterium]